MTIPQNYFPALIDDPVAPAVENDYLALFGYVCLCGMGSSGTAPVACPAHPRPHLYEPTTNTRCARCNRPREEH